MGKINLGECLSQGFEGFKKNPINHIIAMVLVALVSSVGFGLLTGPMLVGYMRIIKRELDGESTSPVDVFKGFDDFVPALVVQLVGGIAVSIGTALCVIPGLLVAPVVPIGLYLVTMGEKDPGNALRRAFEILKENLIDAALCSLVLSLVAGLGALACGIGMLVTVPVAAIGSFVMCRQLIGAGTTEAVAPG